MISNYFKTASGSIFFFDDYSAESASQALARAKAHGSVTHVFRRPQSCGGIGRDLATLYNGGDYIADVYAFKKAS